MNLPNRLTLFRVLLIPLFLVMLLGPGAALPLSHFVAAAIFALASATDWLDGYIARKYQLITNFGKFMDPMADKLLVCAALVALVQQGELPAWVAIVIISREFMVSGFRLVAAEQGLVIAAGFWGKWKTAVTMVMILFVLLRLPGTALFSQMLIYGAVVLTLLSAGDYLYQNRQVFQQDHSKGEKS